MFCRDILNIIASFLGSIEDVIHLHHLNATSRKNTYNITLNTNKILPDFIYTNFKIT